MQGLLVDFGGVLTTNVFASFANGFAAVLTATQNQGLPSFGSIHHSGAHAAVAPGMYAAMSIEVIGEK